VTPCDALATRFPIPLILICSPLAYFRLGASQPPLAAGYSRAGRPKTGPTGSNRDQPGPTGSKLFFSNAAILGSSVAPTGSRLCRKLAACERHHCTCSLTLCRCGPTVSWSLICGCNLAIAISPNCTRSQQIAGKFSRANCNARRFPISEHQRQLAVQCSVLSLPFYESPRLEPQHGQNRKS
jgi:hypothetical protein